MDEEHAVNYLRDERITSSTFFGIFPLFYFSATTPIQKGKFIPKGGIFVIGEEQDSLEGEFTPSESFIGDLSQLNIWDRELSANEIYDLATMCGHQEGNVVAWSDFSSQKTGHVQKTSPSLACDCKYKTNHHRMNIFIFSKLILL